MTNKLNQFTTHSSLFTNFAFTLAETLIVMGIIGVVAALTLPNLNSSTGDKEKVAKVKKIYSNLQDAFGRAQAVYGPYDEWCINLNTYNCTTRTGERITEFMKISKICGTSNGCFSNQMIKSMDKIDLDPSFYSNSDCYKIITADGTSIAFSQNDISIDIDGPNNGINAYCRDLFGFDIRNNSIEPSGIDQDSSGNISLRTYYTGTGCTFWIVQNDNMDYLKVDSNGKCANNIQLSWTNTTCK